MAGAYEQQARVSPAEGTAMLVQLQATPRLKRLPLRSAAKKGSRRAIPWHLFDVNAEAAETEVDVGCK